MHTHTLKRLGCLLGVVVIASCSDNSNPTSPGTPPEEPTFSVEISAAPDSGQAPLENVEVTVQVSGISTGNFRYLLDCENDNAWEFDIASRETTQKFPCSYSDPGTYTATAKIERSGVKKKGSTNITVTKPALPPLSASLFATPDSGQVMLYGVDFKVVVEGRETREYAQYMIDCESDGEWEFNEKWRADSVIVRNLCNYTTTGLYTSKASVRTENRTAITQTTVIATPPTPVGQRSYGDRPDDFAGAQAHIIYVLPSDVEGYRDINGEIEASIGSAQNWLKEQTNGGHFKLDTYQGQLDISFFRLSDPEAEVTEFQQELQDAGYIQPQKTYIAYYDGTIGRVPCGIGGGGIAVIFLKGGLNDEGGGCANVIPLVETADSPPGIMEFVFVHEFLHNLGIVSPDAPHVGYNEYSGKTMHACDHEHDLMTGSGCNGGLQLPVILDYGRDDYYNPNGLPDGIINLHDSEFWNKGG